MTPYTLPIVESVSKLGTAAENLEDVHESLVRLADEAAPVLRPAIAEAVDLIDRADEILTRAAVEHCVPTFKLRRAGDEQMRLFSAPMK